MPTLVRPNFRLLLALSLLLVFAVLAPTSGDAQDAGTLNGKIAAENRAIEGTHGHLTDVRKRLASLQSSLNIQQDLLYKTRVELKAKREKLIRLRVREEGGREILAKQLTANYETPPPDLVNVVMNAKGFADLLERAQAVKAIEHANAQTIQRLRDSQTAVADQTKRLAKAEADQARQEVTVLAQRDQIAEIELSLSKREKLHVDRRAGLKKKLKQVQADLAKAQVRAALASGLITQDVPAPTSIPGFTPHGGKYGFFQGPGTNYSFGDEPKIVARLDALGKAIHAHLIGISGYRTPQHSVAVGGFPNDPHTRGEASDTLGTESIAEVILNKFGLTRPFSAFSERDHIQLVGSSRDL